ncbi:MAG: FtsX-like permease family protein [Verrucomicrobiota bacterium]|jgi:putative ABC transport system permease protein
MSTTLLYVLRNLGRRRTRAILGALGIFLTLALLTAVQVGLDSVSISYIDLVSLQAGKADLLITRPGGDPFNPPAFDPAEIIAKLKDNPHLRGLAPRWLGIVQVSAGSREQYAVLVGVDPQRERELDIAGMVPEPALGAETCAVSKALAEKLQAKAGASLSVRCQSTFSEQNLRLEGVIERQLVLPQQVRDYIVVGPAAARALLNEPDRVQVLAGALRNPRAYYDARDLHSSVLRLKDAGAAVAAGLGLDYDVRLPKAAAITAFQNFTSPLRAVFGVFALLALGITGLLLYSLISVAVEERIREYAILRTLGARRSHIFHLVLSESLLLCFLGVVPGVLAGTVLARLMVKIIGLAMGAQGAALTVEVAPATLWLTLAAGIVLSAGSALVPALHATRWRIVDALDPLRRGQIPAAPVREGQANRPLVLAGVALSGLSVVVFFVLPAAFLSGNPSLIGTVVLCLLLSILLGFTLMMVGLLPFVQRLLFLGLGWAFEPATELAARNLERHRRRHTTTALLFTLSVALVIFIASLVALFSRLALAVVEHTHGADLRIHAVRPEGETLKADLARVPGVAAVSEVKFLHNRSELGVAYDVVAGDLVGMKYLWVVPFGADADLAKVLYADHIVCEAGSPGAIGGLASRRVRLQDPSPTNPAPPIILSLAAARFLEVTAGDQVQLSFRLGAERSDARFRVAAVCSAVPGLENFRGRLANAVGSGVLISLENFQAMTRAAPAEAFQALYFARANGGAAAQKAVAAKVRQEFDVRYRFGIQCTAEQKDEARVIYWATQVFFGLLLGVAVVIAVFALIASMASTVIERQREIGVLKALGLRRRQLFRLFLGESVVLTLSAGIAGGAIGFTLAWLFVLQTAALIELAAVFTMPYLTFLATFAISVVAGALAAYLPTRRLLRKPAAEILRM